MFNGQTSTLHWVVSQIPSGLFILTTAHDGRRHGVLARWVQRCATTPPMVMVALPKGQPVEPLILDSRSFALCQISAGDRFLLRKFAVEADRGDDPFDSIETTVAPSGAPIIQSAVSYVDCDVVRHVELDSDHRIYVGQIQSAALLRQVDKTDRLLSWGWENGYDEGMSGSDGGESDGATKRRSDEGR